MNKIESMTDELRDWATLAAHEYDDAVQRAREDGEFQDWKNSVIEAEGFWSEDDCLHKWLRTNPPTITEPPIDRPWWVTERQITADWIADFGAIDWWIADEGTVGQADVRRDVCINADGTVTTTGAVHVMGTGEQVEVLLDDLDRVIDVLIATRDAFRGN